MRAFLARCKYVKRSALVIREIIINFNDVLLLIGLGKKDSRDTRPNCSKLRSNVANLQRLTIVRCPLVGTEAPSPTLGWKVLGIPILPVPR